MLSASSVSSKSRIPTDGERSSSPQLHELLERPVLSSKSNDEEIMKEVCLNNGICFSKLESEGPAVKVLEMFFSGYPWLIGMNHFPNIHTLTIIGQCISHVNGLSTLVKLRELWVAECQIKKIDGLEKCTLLQKLYLYGNQIERIENLDSLQLVEILWLNNNCIKNIENLSHLMKLKELNIAENRIETIGHSLDFNINIEELNLSGNPISSLRDLTSLVRLPILKSLSLKDPLYSPCPVSQLCNYSAYVLYHFPSLQYFDTYDVSIKHLSDLAQSTVIKKKMFYHMRIKTIHRRLTSFLHQLSMYKDEQLLSLPCQILRQIICHMKEIEREIDESTLKTDSLVNDTKSERASRDYVRGSGDSSVVCALRIKHEVLKQRRAFWEQKCTEIETFFTDAEHRLKEAASCMISRLTIELETGGNVRFEEGSSSDPWYVPIKV